VQHDVVSLGEDALERDVLAGIVARRVLEIIDEALFAVGDAGIVLDVLFAGVTLNRLPRGGIG
jgi:hypothetical protein